MLSMVEFVKILMLAIISSTWNHRIIISWSDPRCPLPDGSVLNVQLSWRWFLQSCEVFTCFIFLFEVLSELPPSSFIPVPCTCFKWIWFEFKWSIFYLQGDFFPPCFYQSPINTLPEELQHRMDLLILWGSRVLLKVLNKLDHWEARPWCADLKLEHHIKWWL